MRSRAWRWTAVLVPLLLSWAIRGKFGAVIIGGGLFLFTVIVGIGLVSSRIFEIKSRRLLRFFSRLNRCLAWAWLGAILGFGLGYVSHLLEENRAREFVATVEPRLKEYKQTHGRFPETIESLGLKRPRVDLMKIEYSADESEFTFRYPNSFSLFGGDWEYRFGSWSDS